MSCCPKHEEDADDETMRGALMASEVSNAGSYVKLIICFPLNP